MMSVLKKIMSIFRLEDYDSAIIGTGLDEREE